jgi:ligand-binding SRPBCC domain-containing protein
MGRVVLHTRVAAPPERVFDLTRHIGFHTVCYRHARERAVAGCTDGLIGPGETVTFRMHDFAVPHEMTVLITEFDRPRHFRDTQTDGVFARFDHDHHFEARDGVTVMTDVFDFTPPFGPLGRLLERMFLKRRIAASMRRRNETLRRCAESEGWREYLDAERQPSGAG